MKAVEILHKDIADSYPQIHSVRLNTLFTFVKSGLRDHRVTVTYLGRGLKNDSKTSKKHDIKRSDRLIGNQHLHRERFCFYKQMTAALVGNNRHPLIIVDWSPINSNDKFHVLRASIPMGGRALVLYEKVYPERELNSNYAHQSLLDTLEKSLPDDCQPIFSSDAIFKTPWFKAVEQKNWYWVGRVRGTVTLSVDRKSWHRCTHWFKQAGAKATLIDELYYTKTHLFKCQGVVYKEKRKGRENHRNRGGKYLCSMEKYQQNKAKEPWFLVFNLPKQFSDQAHRVVKIYQQRMQIEENFRDTKNARVGIGLEYSISRSAKRFDNLLLIAALILFILWCIGYAVSQTGKHYLLQANTIKSRRVLSLIYLGREVIDDKRYQFDDDFIDVWKQLSHLCIKVDDLC